MTATKNAATQKFAVQLRKIDDVRPYERNPRLNDQAVDAVAASLAEFGFRQPIHQGRARQVRPEKLTLLNALPYETPR